MIPEIKPDFGTFALPPERESWRQKAGGYKDSRLGRILISRARKKALAGETGPFDVEIEPGLKARLYPTVNRCEKRAFAGVDTWDAPERAALKTAIASDPASPFIFMDVGANVGLYSLYVHHYARAADRSAQIIAVEPGVESCARLEANIAANKADIQIIRSAVSDQPGNGYLTGGETNRGEAHLSETGGIGEEVVIDTLPRIARTLGLTRIHAMKVDIEGQDLKALTTFFEDAALRLHPDLLIVETGRVAESPLIELCLSHGYSISERTRLNTIFIKTPLEKA